MKAVVIAAAVSMMMIAGFAHATGNSQTSNKSVPAQIRSLRAQVKSLNLGYRLLNRRVQDLEIQNVCLKPVAPISQFAGYHWTDGVGEYITTALDVSPDGVTPQAWVQLVNPSCIQGQSFHTSIFSGSAKAAWKRHAIKAFRR